MPLISVVIATHNYAHFLPDAIRSVQAQTFTDWECIVVDDCSTDNTACIVAEFINQDARIRHIRNDQNLGEAGSRNVGNSAAAGDLLCSLDADDYWHAEKLAKQVRSFLRDRNLVCSFTGVRVFGTQDSAVCVEPEKLSNFDGCLHKENMICHSSVMLRKDAVMQLGGYSASLPYAVDWDLWLRILLRFGKESFSYCPELLMNYRIHGNNMSRDYRKTIQGERSVAWSGLVRGHWWLRHPVSAIQVINAQLDRELSRHLAAGNRRDAVISAFAITLFSPWRRWMWSRALHLLSQCSGAT